MVNIGKIVNTHGIRGEVRIRTNSDFVDLRFQQGAKFQVKIKSGEETLIVENAYPHKTFIVTKFKTYDNINDVIKFKGADIFAEPLTADDLNEGEFLNSDLEKCYAYTQEGEIIGKISKVVENPGHNLLRIKREEGGNVLVPFTDFFVPEIDLKNKKVTINVIEGLL